MIRNTTKWTAVTAALLMTSGGAPVAPSLAAGVGPSFDCARVTAQVNKLICATPALATLDSKLAGDFSATLHQGGIDARALQADEDRWLKTIRNHCADVACLTRAYAARDAAVLDQSLRAASPAAYAETRPYPSPATALSVARAMVGRSCIDAASAPVAGFTRIQGDLPVVTQGATVEPLEAKGARFAFLLLHPVAGACVVADVTALPAANAGMAFLQCTLGDDGDHGFGVRRAGNPEATAYWSIDLQSRRLIRQPLGVLAGEKLLCQQPETGE